MEWNFLFRVDHLNQTGEERNLKGLITTEGSQPPRPEQIQQFLKECGFEAQVEDPIRLIFRDPNPADPVKITIVRLDNEEKAESDRVLKLLSEQFGKQYNL